MDATRFQTFAAHYREFMREGHAAGQYPLWPASLTPDAVADKMLSKILETGRAGCVNISDGYTFKKTIKALGLKPTYKAVDAFLAGNVTAEAVTT